MYIGMDEIFTTVMVVLSVCGGISTVWGAVKVWREFRKPQEKRNEKLEDLEDRVADSEEALDEIASAMPILMKAMTLIIEHMVSGDGVDDLKECQQDIHMYLIDQVGKGGRKHGSR